MNLLLLGYYLGIVIIILSHITLMLKTVMLPNILKQTNDLLDKFHGTANLIAGGLIALHFVKTTPNMNPFA